MLKSTYGHKSFSDDFVLDISKIGGCKGILMLEIYVTSNSSPLVLKDGSNQQIKGNEKPFKIESSHPIINGVLKFEFKENKNLIGGNSSKKAVVRYLYCE